MYVDGENIGNTDSGTDTSGGVLHRSKRDLSWDDVETFYDDKNNFAMYLVLPIIVLVYGGCAVIYCIARCRRYLRRKKKKAHKRQIIEDEPIEEPQTTHIPSVPVSRNPNGSATQRNDGASSSSDVRVSVERDPETPLPWQVPAGGAAVVTAVPPRNDRKQPSAFNNSGYEKDYDEKKQPPPPSYDETYKPNVRPMSKPPPYEEKGIRQRRGSVEEIITLDAPRQNTPDYNDRKRKRPGSRVASRQSVPRVNDYDEERERARQLVRGDRQRREPPPPQPPQEKENYRQKTPDIISHARTQPLKPQYKPTHNDPKAEATLMAKQAAQLLRLDQQGRQGGMKQKRLVFVAE